MLLSFFTLLASLAVLVTAAPAGSLLLSTVQYFERPDSLLALSPSSSEVRTVCPFLASADVVAGGITSLDSSVPGSGGTSLLFVGIGRPPEQSYSLATLNVSSGASACRVLANVSLSVSGGALYDLVYDAASASVIGIFARDGTVRAVNPNTGAAKQIAKFPQEWCLLGGAVAFDTKSRTYYALFEDGEANHQLLMVDVARASSSLLVIDRGLNPMVVYRGQLLGWSSNTLWSLDFKTATTTALFTLPGGPTSGGLAADERSSLLYMAFQRYGNSSLVVLSAGTGAAAPVQLVSNVPIPNVDSVRYLSYFPSRPFAAAADAAAAVSLA